MFDIKDFERDWTHKVQHPNKQVLSKVLIEVFGINVLKRMERMSALINNRNLDLELTLEEN